MSAPALVITIEVEGYPRLRLVAETLEAELSLRRWLSLGYARRDIARALDNLDAFLEEQAA